MEFGLDFDRSQFDSAMGDMKEKTPRALMWSLREGGRAVISASRPAAPVLSGLLRSSIRNARNIKGDASGMVLWTAPFGPEVAEYSGVQNERFGYMKANAAEKATTAAHSAFTKAFAQWA